MGGDWSQAMQDAERAFLDRGFTVNAGPDLLLPDGEGRSITVKLVEGDDGRIWAYPDMNADYRVDRDELGNLRPALAVYDPSTRTVNEDDHAIQVATARQ